MLVVLQYQVFLLTAQETKVTMVVIHLLVHSMRMAEVKVSVAAEAQVEVAVVLQAHQHLLVVVILVYLLQEALLDVLLVAQVQLLY